MILSYQCLLFHYLNDLKENREMNIQEKIIKNYPLNEKIDCELNCYSLDKRRYIVFWDNLIKKRICGTNIKSSRKKDK